MICLEIDCDFEYSSVEESFIKTLIEIEAQPPFC